MQRREVLGVHFQLREKFLLSGAVFTGFEIMYDCRGLLPLY